MSLLTELADKIKTRINNLLVKDLPIGSLLLANYATNTLTNHANLSLPSLLEYYRLYSGDYIHTSTTNGIFIDLSTNKMVSAITTPTMLRAVGSYNSDTSFTLLNTQSSVYQNTANGSSFSNYNFDYLPLNTFTNDTYYADPYSNKVVFLLNNYSYIYSNDGINFSFAKSPIISGSHATLTTPMISDNVFSFWSNSQSKQIYTTDHITFSDVVSFGGQNIVHRMSNGHLYNLNGATGLRVSTNNGINWTNYTLPVAPASSNNHCLDYNGTTYVYGTSTNALYSSTDLTSWTLRTSNISGTPALQRVWYINGTFFVFSATSANSSFSTSTDGITWTNRTSPNAIIGNAVIYVNSLYMILANDRVITSPDLVTWTSSIAFGNSDILALSRSFYGTGSKAFMISGTSNYFYNSGSWTTVTNAQQRTNLRALASTVSLAITKVY